MATLLQSPKDTPKDIPDGRVGAVAIVS